MGNALRSQRGRIGFGMKVSDQSEAAIEKGKMDDRCGNPHSGQMRLEGRIETVVIEQRGKNKMIADKKEVQHRNADKA